MGDEQDKGTGGSQGGGAGTGGSGTGGTGGEPTGSTTERTFTQADLDRIATREKNEGKTAAMNEVAQTLGVSVEEAKQIIEAKRAADDAAKDEATRAREAADRERAEAEEEKRKAAQARHDLAVERHLIRAFPAGAEVTDDQIARISRMVTAQVGSDDAAIKADVEQLKTDFPELFKKTDGTGDGGGGGGGTGRAPAPNGDPGGAPPKPNLSEDAEAKGRARARQKLGIKDDDK